MVLPVPRKAPAVTLLDGYGHRYSLAEPTHGKLTLLVLGYTNCPDVCPLQLANLAAALPKLSPAAREQITVLFVSTDPLRDTPARLRTWLSAFDSSFVGLRGSVADVDAIERAFALPSSVREGTHAESGYAVAHASIVLAITSDGFARVGYTVGTMPLDWVHDLPLLLAGNK